MATTIPSTQQLVFISEIRDRVILLKDGSLRAVIEVSAINFELLSEDEQVAIIQNFQNFINSLDFPLQISMISRRLSIDGYLKLTEETASQLNNELLVIQASEYIKFIKELSSLTNIMSKRFYITVPFYIFETPGSTGIIKSLKSMVGSAGSTKKITDEQFSNYENQLMQRVDVALNGLTSLGLKTEVLEKDKLVKVFYGLYNPKSIETQSHEQR